MRHIEKAEGDYQMNIELKPEEQKKNLRRLIRGEAARLPELYCREADRAIAGHIFQMPEYEHSQTIFCYAGTAREIDTEPILLDALERGKKVGVPLCTGKGIMEVRRIRSLEDLTPGAYGIREPSAAADLVLPEEIDLALIPCASCGKTGIRLGYGGGYYDRYLPQVKAPKAVLCRSRLMRSDIPAADHDCPMDYVISENGVIRCRTK